jgi:hypothetical protein
MLKGKEKKWKEKDVVHKMRDATKGCKACGGNKSGLCSPITLDELKAALYKVKTGKAAGPDGITNEMIKHLSSRGEIEMLCLLNQSWTESVCAGIWRLGEIIPLPKPGKDHKLTGSYRPINLLSVIGKLLERIVKARLEFFLESNNKLDPNQAGFRKGRSTVEQIGRLTQSIYDGFEDGLRTLVVYVDFSRPMIRSGGISYMQRWAIWKSLAATRSGSSHYFLTETHLSTGMAQSLASGDLTMGYPREVSFPHCCG